MNLINKYESIFTDAKSKIYSEETYYDSLIEDEDDRRRGITLLIRPNNSIKQKLIETLSVFKQTEPNQYFYPESNIHVTVLSIISCYPDFDLKNINLREYIQVVEQSLESVNPFLINFDGLTASSDCVMVKGFYENNTLDLLRNKVRKDLTNTSLQQSLDKRYTLETAHSTILRLKAQLEDKDAYVHLIEKYRCLHFGNSLVDELELVYNDWYHKKDKVTVLHRFKLRTR